MNTVCSVWILDTNDTICSEKHQTIKQRKMHLQPYKHPTIRNPHMKSEHCIAKVKK